MLVKDIYLKNFAKASPEASVYDLVKLSTEEKTNGIFIVDDNNHLLGLVTIFEILKAIVPNSLKEKPELARATSVGLFLERVNKKRDLKAKDFMLQEPPKVYLDTKLIEIAANSLQTEHYRIPVVNENNQLIGVVNRSILRELIAKELKILT